MEAIAADAKIKTPHFLMERGVG